MYKALLALSFGTFGLGVAEFSMMAILPQVAADLGISIPRASGLVSAYAAGVCVGAPLLVVLRNQPLKRLLLLLSVVMIVGNALSTLAPGYGLLMAGRFMAGLPHGAYFGVATVVAMKVAAEGRGASAVAAMVAGMTVANLAGVPLSTVLAQLLTWRAVFAFVALWSVVVGFFVWRMVPDVGALPRTTFRSQFRFLRRRAPWLVLLTTMLGNGGIFAWYSFVSPMLTERAGFSVSAVSGLMVQAGAGMVAGNVMGGLLCDRFPMAHVVLGVQLAVVATLVLLFLGSTQPVVAVVGMMLATAGLFAVSSPQQTLIVRCAPGGELLGGACIQVAFNLGNALGAQVGAVPLRLGLDYAWPALAGALLVSFGALTSVALVRTLRRNAPLAA